MASAAADAGREVRLVQAVVMAYGEGARAWLLKANGPKLTISLRDGARHTPLHHAPLGGSMRKHRD